MSRRGNCWDNAVAESFFSSLKRAHQEADIQPGHALADIFDYIEYSTTGPGAIVSSRRRQARRPSEKAFAVRTETVQWSVVIYHLKKRAWVNTWPVLTP